MLCTDFIHSLQNFKNSLFRYAHSFLSKVLAHFLISNLFISNVESCLLYACVLFHFVDDMQALGMESGAIADSQLTTSSEWSAYQGSKRGRLHTKENGLGTGAWSSLTSDLNQWLQVDLGKNTPVTHVATQGRNSWSPAQMVTEYKLQFSDNGASFLFYKRQGESSDAVNSEIIL